MLSSHDCYFLDKIAGRILELENGRVRDYPGNYSAYARQKRAEHERMEKRISSTGKKRPFRGYRYTK